MKKENKVPDFLKVNPFAHSELSDNTFCAEMCFKNAIKHVKL